jgi:XTP/dITP diphosphohydrolase
LTTLILATRNAHKIEEIRNILSGQYRCLALRDFPDAPEVVEDANSFAGNATKKSVQLARWLGSVPSSQFRVPGSSVFVLADDSGLGVDALGGAPGVHSARFAATDAGAVANSPDSANNAKLLRLLKHVPLEKRTARFRCVIALTPLPSARTENSSPVCYSDESEMRTEIFDGACEGHIAFAPAGTGGFGYDPLFIPVGFDKSFAELGEGIKNQLSHRAKALQKLSVWLRALP